MTIEKSAGQRLTVRSPQEGEAWWWFGGLAVIKLAEAETEGRFSMIDMIWPPGLEVPLHVHTREDELFHVLDGRVSYRIGESRFEASAGHTVFAPRDIPHNFVVTSAQPAHYLIVYSPAGFEGFVRESSQPAERLSLPPQPASPPDVAVIQKLSELMSSKYGCHFVS